METTVHSGNSFSSRGLSRKIIFFAAVLLAGVVRTAVGQGSQATSLVSGQTMTVELHQEDALFPNYKFRDGGTLSQLRLHYVTIGTPHKDAAGSVDNAVLLLHWTNSSSQSLSSPEFKDALFAGGAPLDAGHFFVIIPDNVGHGHSSKPSDGLKAAFPHYGYEDMVDLQHKLVVEKLGISHLRAVIGMSMGCMNAWQWAEAYPGAMDGVMPIACFPTAISGRNLLWRRVLIDGIRSDPRWNNGNYENQPPSAAAGLLLARMMIDGVPALQQEVPNSDAADGIIREVKVQAESVDANDLLYTFESSRDFNAESGLSQITTKVFALNFADDEFYRDSLQILERDMQRVRQGRTIIRPVSPGSAGHFSMSHPKLWSDQVEEFMHWLNTN